MIRKNMKPGTPNLGILHNISQRPFLSGLHVVLFAGSSPQKAPHITSHPRIS
jgi:hypothetical protein